MNRGEMDCQQSIFPYLKGKQVLLPIYGNVERIYKVSNFVLELFSEKLILILLIPAFYGKKLTVLNVLNLPEIVAKEAGKP